MDEIASSLAEVEEAGLLTQKDGCLRLTSAGRMVSNEVFGRLLLEPVT